MSEKSKRGTNKITANSSTTFIRTLNKKKKTPSRIYCKHAQDVSDSKFLFCRHHIQQSRACMCTAHLRKWNETKHNKRMCYWTSNVARQHHILADLFIKKRTSSKSFQLLFWWQSPQLHLQEEFLVGNCHARPGVINIFMRFVFCGFLYFALNPLEIRKWIGWREK